MDYPAEHGREGNSRATDDDTTADKQGGIGNDQAYDAQPEAVTLPSIDSRYRELDAPATAPSTSLVEAVSVLREPLSSAAADTRRLAQRLAVHWFRGDAVHPALSIISAERGEGRTSTAINLACVYAQATVRTLLIDADLHNPTVHVQLGLDPDASDKGVPIPVEGVPNLSVLPASHISKGPHDRLVPSALGGLIEHLRSHFDVILVDTPAAAVGEDYLFAGLATGGGLVVTREGQTKVKAIAKVLNSCEDAGIKIVGGTMLER
ncbi:tyrosine-protein kinase family protein [Croceibacterium ferulae]|uniref:tyrosine-protein kinase family protein n=1 Tax=Croceibacterium ferulae TaxID=1854641 RepID=UPI000EAC183F|nr:CpsD/CapB family tyrosine-protein kinase [Croceibacterium ferulae]